MLFRSHGVPRVQAYEMVQRNAIAAAQEHMDFAYYLLQDEEVMSFISIEELDSLFDYEYYLKHFDYIYKRAGIF